MKNQRLLFIVFVINIIGTIFGFIYYSYLFEIVPKKYWMFVPDSPLSTMLFASAILLILLDKKNDLLSFIGSASVIKYGLWTMFVIAYFPDHFLASAQREFYYLMFFLHLGMVIQPVFILHTIEHKRYHLVFALLWFFTNDYLDYIKGINPLTTHGLPLDVVGKVTAALTLLSSLTVYGFKLKKNKYLLDYIRRHGREGHGL